MASILKILRRIGGTKAFPSTGSAGELAIWKASAASTADLAFYVHDGTQYVPVVDTDVNVTLVKPGAGTAGRVPTANAAGAVSWAALAAASPSITVTGTVSLTGGGDLTANRTLSLVNDNATPGNSFYYGTDATGAKGYYALPSGGGGAGDVTGPGSSTDNALARFDGTTGKIVQNSLAILDDTGNLTGVKDFNASGNVHLGSTPLNTLTIGALVATATYGLRAGAASHGNMFVLSTNGHVGFNQTSPASMVDVNGVASHNVAASTGVMDLAIAQMFTETSTANATWSFTNVPASRGLTVVLHLTNGGAFTLVWPTSVKWPGGTAPTLTASGTDVLVFVTHDGGATWRGNVFGRNVR